eukprot:364490-Chlamydomonas_euryale.AAC.11
MFSRQGSATEALPYWRRVLAAREAVGGAGVPSAAQHVAQCLLDTGDAAAALPLFERALGGRTSDAGGRSGSERPPSGDALACMVGAADCHAALGEADEAQDMYMRVGAVVRVHVGVGGWWGALGFRDKCVHVGMGRMWMWGWVGGCCGGYGYGYVWG